MLRRSFACALVAAVLGAASPWAGAQEPSQDAPPSGAQGSQARGPGKSAQLGKAQAEHEVQRGLASWYGPGFQGRPTASGEPFDMHDLTAAHRTLPFGTVVRVQSLVNGRTVDVRINDRGPYLNRRIIDLSRAAAQALGLLQARTGTKPVRITVLSRPPDAV